MWLKPLPLVAGSVWLLMLAGSGWGAQERAPTPLPWEQLASTDSAYRYGTKTPYPAPGAVAYQPPPAGFELLMVQHVARHGSRGLSSPGDDLLSLMLWQQAQREGALTPLGEQLGPVLAQILHLHQAQLGYGQLSGLGASEHRAMAQRLVQRHPAFFAAAAAAQQPLRVQHSGRTRAQASALHFSEGLRAALPGLADSLLAPQPAPATLYFYKAEGSVEASHYQAYRAEHPGLQQVLADLGRDALSRQVVQAVLAGLYREEFIQRLARGVYVFESADDGGRLSSPEEAVAALYSLYVISSNLQAEVALDFERFIRPEHATWLAQLDDTEAFYQRGPGFAGEDITWRGAQVLVAEMFERIEQRLVGQHHSAADLRFTHAQVLIPLASYLGLASASEAAPAHQPYRYANNPWRGARVAPMGANIQWDIYRDSTGRVLVTQLHQEQQVRFLPDCPSDDDSGWYYELRRLQACYRARLAAP